MPAKFVFHAEDEAQSFFGEPQIWDNTLKMVGGTETDYTFVDDTTGNVHKSDPRVRADVDTAVNEFTGSKIYVTKNGTTCLTDFIHPRDAIYVFGVDGGKITGIDCRPPTGVNTTLKIGDAGNLWATEALAIVLWDRKVKTGSWL